MVSIASTVPLLLKEIVPPVYERYFFSGTIILLSAASCSSNYLGISCHNLCAPAEVAIYQWVGFTFVPPTRRKTLN
jgi:hypothetical protein